MEKKISIIGLLVNLMLCIVKVSSGIISKSSSIIAEGLHSGMDVVSSFINYLGVSISKKPADKRHPFGYQRAQVLSGLFITIILFVTGLWIIYESALSIIEPAEVVVDVLSVGIMLFSAAVNEIMSRLKLKYGKKYENISLISDGMHSRVDVLTSLAVVGGLFAFRFLGITYADAAVAFLIGAYIIKKSFDIGKEAADSLLDVTAGEDVEKRIREIAKSQGIGVQSLRTIKRGPKIFAYLVVSLPTNLKIDVASGITRKLEKSLLQKISSMDYVTIEIKSHGVSESYHKGILGQGFGWQGKGRMGGESMGPGGYCICRKCNYRQKHEAGIPCSSLKCPKCGANMERK